MLRKVGFFHFGNRGGGDDPIESLKAALQDASRKDDLSECLVVTPEAFNVLGDYYNPESRRLDGSVAESLREVSLKFGVAIVAGLIDVPAGQELGYSSTYVIDGDVHELLSRKMAPDKSGLLQALHVELRQATIPPWYLHCRIDLCGWFVVQP